ncbi:hypothetical protein CRG98_042335 [Punica granatum]|uniref:RNase H type-1 domain-containing protein n=1 Tax=Punica granatum TaxID=22663 RepID=A0A2I0HZZ4_PUNGR|nr:hypothetical protein CRG98_042335 [Punica granatum]
MGSSLDSPSHSEYGLCGRQFGWVDIPKPRCIGIAHACPDEIKFGCAHPVAAKIDFPCTNNVAEYEACILGLQAVIDFKVKELEVFGDSMLTIFQTLGQWKTKDAKLVPYHEYLERLTENFEDISFTYTPRMMCAPEFNLVGARMREAYETRLGSIHLPGDARRTRVRRSRHLPFYDLRVEGRQVTRV